MPGDVTTSVTAVVSVVDKATPAIAQITESLKGVEQVQQQINQTAAAMPEGLQKVLAGTQRTLDEIKADVPRSVEEQRRLLEASGLLRQQPWQKIHEEGGAAGGEVADAMAANAEKIGSIWDHLKDRLSGIGTTIKTKLGAAFEYVSGVASKVGGALSKAFGSMGGLFGGAAGFGVGYGVAAAFGAITDGMNDLVATVDKLGPTASNIGITIGELQRFTLWAREGGAPVEGVTKSLENLTKTIGGINAGMKGPGIKRASEAFESLGLLDAEGKVRITDTTELLKEMARGLAGIADPQERAATAAAALGSSWRAMLPLLMQGPEAIDRAAEASKRLGEISPEMQKAAEGYKKTQEDFATSMESLKMSLGVALIPVLKPLIEQMTNWIALNREWLAQDVGGAIQSIVTGFQKLNEWCNTIVDSVNAVQHAFEAAGTWTHDWIVTIGTGIKAALDTPLTDIASWIGEKLSGIGAAIQAAIVTPLAEKAGTIWDGVKERWSAALAGIGDVVGGAWDAAAQALTRAWNTIEPILSKFWDMLKQIAEWTGLGGLTTAFGSIATSISKAQEAWARWKGETPAPGAGTTPGVGGGPPLTWETLQPPPLIGPFPQAANGQVNVVIENKNPPPGTRTSATTTGKGVTADVGQSMPWTAPAYSGPWAPGAAGAPG